MWTNINQLILKSRIASDLNKQTKKETKDKFT